MQSRSNESGNVRDIDHHICSDLVAYLSYSGKVDGSRICTRARNDHLRLALESCGSESVVIEHLGIVRYIIGDDIEVLTGNIYGRAVREVSAVSKIESHNGIARLKKREENGKIRRCAAVRLNIGMICAEQLLCAVARNVLDDIDILTSAVISLSGQTLSILIGKHGPRCEQHALRNNILGGYQLDVMTLTLKLKRAGIIDLFIIRGKFIKKIHIATPSFLLEISLARHTALRLKRAHPPAKKKVRPDGRHFLFSAPPRYVRDVPSVTKNFCAYYSICREVCQAGNIAFSQIFDPAALRYQAKTEGCTDMLCFGCAECSIICGYRFLSESSPSLPSTSSSFFSLWREPNALTVSRRSANSTIIYGCLSRYGKCL